MGKEEFDDVRYPGSLIVQSIKDKLIRARYNFWPGSKSDQSPSSSAMLTVSANCNFPSENIAGIVIFAVLKQASDIYISERFEESILAHETFLRFEEQVHESNEILQHIQRSLQTYQEAQAHSSERASAYHLKMQDLEHVVAEPSSKDINAVDTGYIVSNKKAGQNNLREVARDSAAHHENMDMMTSRKIRELQDQYEREQAYGMHLNTQMKMMLEYSPRERSFEMSLLLESSRCRATARLWSSRWQGTDKDSWTALSVKSIK